MTFVVVAGLFYGTIAGDDDLFPLGPMVQFAFSVPPDGEIRSLHLEAEIAGGRRVEIPIEPWSVGTRRAEIEGQVRRYRRDPSLLRPMAVAHARLRPADPRPTVLHLVTRVIKLKDRRPSGESVIEEAVWAVR
ncbi:hypothetical protein [Spongiactinospora sp. TRM90649]|uniref:hypothetical protein n=1 Tax=Spongiactinospora sp. TRM90649 TaxID=3031114 RepID=UPI0023F63B65|nr:hypothetical protein [Spongiactinospora sp. TRM90649]MDF5754514.1 hypothetical protein [Spongiactinospora sp. TRM90649]